MSKSIEQRLDAIEKELADIRKEVGKCEDLPPVLREGDVFLYKSGSGDYGPRVVVGERVYEPGTGAKWDVDDYKLLMNYVVVLFNLKDTEGGIPKSIVAFLRDRWTHCGDYLARDILNEFKLDKEVK